MSENKKLNMSSEDLRTLSANQVVEENPGLTSSPDALIDAIYKRYVDNKLYEFPSLCIETRRVNYLKWKAFRAQGNDKGWSKKKDFKFDYDIPRELYLFMVNMVYRNFWAEENEKVWRSFMKGILRGDDPTGLLRKVKVHYLDANK